MKIAIFPGSFDPVTQGHVAVVRAALPLFDKIYVAIGVNAEKKGFFALSDRKVWLSACFANEQKVEVIDYEGLTIELCQQLGATYLIRGIRNPLDFQYEADIAHANKQLCPQVETLFFATAPELSHVSSTVVRDVFRYNGDWSVFVPDCVKLRR